MPDYAKELNPAQFEAVTAPAGHTLVVAGAGTGKTRTIVYRLAWLVEQGVAPESILLLTFTRKAAREMLSRAETLLGQGLGSLVGGTFHAFAFSCLRAHRPDWLEGRTFTLMDSADISQTVKECKEKLNLGKKDHSFPKIQTIVGLLSKARNKELPVAEILRQESFHLLPHADAIEAIGKAYAAAKRDRALLDYDDLLFELEGLLQSDAGAAAAIRGRFRHILVDEYQDTNLVQARIVRLLAQPAAEGLPCPLVMAVGDEAQSIYAFRGANVQNILNFPRLFPPCRIVRLEQNYRSTQPILDVANGILDHAAESFRKNLFTAKMGGNPPRLLRPDSDLAEAELVTKRVEELLTSHRPHEIAVLFRAGFHSYGVENSLRKAGIAFRKYGGLRFVEAAHIKDVLAFARLMLNPLDFSAFGRLAMMHKGIGPKTMTRLYNALVAKTGAELQKTFSKAQGLWQDLEFIKSLRDREQEPASFLEAALDYYRPRMEDLYPDDWPSRLQGLEEILHIATSYDSLELFVADIALEAPNEEDDPEAENCVTLSTVHSAKGLEWDSVLILDAVEDRFPSRHASARPEDFEEERRLFYVACTRARRDLELYAPRSIYSRNGSVMAGESPFVRELPAKLFQKSKQERSPGGLGSFSGTRSLRTPPASPASIQRTGQKAGYCRHRIFGRGKIIQYLDDNRVQVNFPGFGLKIILGDYLLPED